MQIKTLFRVHGTGWFDNWVVARYFSEISDRNQKTSIEPIIATNILNRVLSLPITKWTFTNAPSIRHIGPMAQDFYAAFGLGIDDKHIGAGDQSGVALAAIQGLNQKLEESLKDRDGRIAELEKTVSELKALLPRLLSSRSEQ